MADALIARRSYLCGLHRRARRALLVLLRAFVVRWLPDLELAAQQVM